MDTTPGHRAVVKILLILAASAALSGCGSPEATRQRGGGPGADVGNHDRIVQMHGGSRPYYHTPRLVRHGAPIESADQAARLSLSGQ